ncbi:U6 snRNA complex subunit LSM4 Ecym_7144 [Eremothecium cymbalariae DBVPG|uniref:LSM complex subunit LSM4 n=1 Tax=Eremothecium cymbalariae (strain CBS 270.75 / DBVPG 7215 / KCTC 17166 / NRRL Y-17582) TaxID=931890 RepID=G8JVX8_ERECY|nr:hypothetical protein Ecym_7144 [Eremothecium cymbalariae DBVPG\
MLPLYLLTNAKGQRMLVELKNGETIEGELTNVDNWMNVTLGNVVHKGGEQVLELPEIYVRGSVIKYIKLQDDIIDKVKQQLNSGKDGSSNGNGPHQNRDRDGNRRYNSRRDNGGGNNGGGRFHHHDYQRKRGGGNFQRRGGGDGQYSSNNGGRRGARQQPGNNGTGNTQGQSSTASGGFVQYHRPMQGA